MNTPTVWGSWVKYPFDTEAPACVRCNISMHLNDDCEWHDSPEFNLCSSCATIVLENLKPKEEAMKEMCDEISLDNSSQSVDEKIALCLSSIDEIIALQTRKLQLLNEHKKGLVQHFSKLKAKMKDNNVIVSDLVLNIIIDFILNSYTDAGEESDLAEVLGNKDMANHIFKKLDLLSKENSEKYRKLFYPEKNDKTLRNWVVEILTEKPSLFVKTDGPRLF